MVEPSASVAPLVAPVVPPACTAPGVVPTAGQHDADDDRCDDREGQDEAGDDRPAPPRRRRLGGHGLRPGGRLGRRGRKRWWSSGAVRADRRRRSGRARGQRGPCRLDQVTAGGEAVLRVLLERAGDDVGDCLRQVGPDGADVGHRSREDGGDERAEVVLRERPAAGEQLEEHDPEGVDVGPAVHGLAGDLLGRGVGDRCRDLAVAGQRRQRGHVLRDAEVGEHRLLAAVVAGLEQDVRRLDVAVEQPAGVAWSRALPTAATISRRAPSGTARAPAGRCADPGRRRSAWRSTAGRRPDPVQDVDDVRVLERAEQVGLALEALRNSGIVANPGCSTFSATSRGSERCRAR